jgi:hypothetical protein
MRSDADSNMAEIHENLTRIELTAPKRSASLSQHRLVAGT